MKRLATAFTALVMSLPISAFAAPVAVSNFSFETLSSDGLPYPCGGPCFFSFSSPVPGWSTTPVYGGQWLIGGYDGNPNPPDGNIMAFLNPDPNLLGRDSLSQNVGVAVAGTTYTLQTSVMHRVNQFMGAIVQLEIDGIVVATATGPDAGGGTWNEFVATYAATAADDGKTLTIRLGVSSGEGDFDNVRLDATVANNEPVPEPASLAILGAGLLGLAGLRRRSR